MAASVIPTRLSGVQHPAPPLTVLAERTPGGMSVTAPFAVAVFDGRNVTSRPPKTEIWCMLYAQVLQADGIQHRNILLTEARLDLVKVEHLDVRTFLARRLDMDIRASNSMAGQHRRARRRGLHVDGEGDPSAARAVQPVDPIRRSACWRSR